MKQKEKVTRGDECQKVMRFVHSKLNYFFTSSNHAGVRADLARLRRGIGKDPGELPELWPITLQDLDEALLSKTGEATFAERSIQTTLALFALHQQGKDLKNQPMHSEKQNLGTSIRMLGSSDKGNADAIKRRFNVLATSDSTEELTHHLRAMIMLLKASSVPTDYRSLSSDLYWFQFPEQRDRIRLRWGQDFYAFSNKN